MSISLNDDRVERDGAIEVRADWDKAISLVLWRNSEQSDWQPTAFLAADVDHDPSKALVRVKGWLAEKGPDTPE